jgi:hypothetical protein
MRCLVVGAILILELASVDGGFAQAARNTSPPSTTATANIQEQHPEWFASKGPYRPAMPRERDIFKWTERLPWLPDAMRVSLLRRNA